MRTVNDMLTFHLRHPYRGGIAQFCREKVGLPFL